MMSFSHFICLVLWSNSHNLKITEAQQFVARVEPVVYFTHAFAKSSHVFITDYTSHT